MNLGREELERLAERALSQPGTDGGLVLSARPDRWVVAWPERGIVVKVYARRAGWRGLLDGIFGDRARRAAAATRTAESRGVRVPKVLGVVGGARGAAVVLEYVGGGRAFRLVRRETRGLSARRALDGRLAELLRDLHAARLYHGDFHQGNVLIDAAGAPVLVDLDGLRAVAFVSRRRRVRNLERLLRDFVGEHRVPRGARLRFLRRYASSAREARDLWRAIEARSSAKRAQYGLPPP